ncbi:hypothetical protein MMC19_000083 [Ptychographa xylographoides]|nr:hypothetical protein [Ptychographa xylographoides]
MIMDNMPTNKPSREANECPCDACERLDIHQTVEQAKLTSSVNADGNRESLDSFDVPVALPQGLKDVGCPLRDFLAAFFSKDLKSDSVNRECFFRLQMRSEDEVIWHWSQFPQGILQAILSVEIIGLSPAPSPVLLSLDKCDDSTSRRWFGTKAVNPTIDYELIKESLQHCETDHQSCNPKGHSTKNPRRVVDLESKLIIPSPEDCRYVALSYVWGRRDESSPETAFEICDITNAMSREILGHLPRAISGAMEIARNLGERYLWVDALCIQQADCPERMNEIRNMNRIFDQAAITIVVLDGNSFDDIPGTKSKPRTASRCAPIHGHIFRELTPNFMDSVKNSVWATRAWTKQEGMLSRHCLVVSGYEAALTCQESCISESNRRAGTEDSIARLPNADRAQIGRGMHNEFFARSIRGGFLYDYTQVIGDYSKRQLSYPSDALNATRGILADYESALNARFFWGLPVDQFQEALAWRPFGQERCHVQRRRSGFPSWSWTSYPGPVSFIYSAMSFCKRYQFFAPFVKDRPYVVDISTPNPDNLLEMEHQAVLVFQALGIDVDVLVDGRNGCCYLATRSEGQRICKIILDVVDDRTIKYDRCSCVLLFDYIPNHGAHGFLFQVGGDEVWKPEGDVWCCVMLVGWIGNTAYRRGVGSLKGDPFHVMDLDWMLLRLG